MPGTVTYTADPPPGDALEALLRRVARGEENALEVTRELLPDGKGTSTRLALQNRRLQPEQPLPPVKLPSPPRAHSLHSVDALVNYLGEHGTPHTVVLGNALLGKATVVLNERAPDGYELLEFAPPYHPVHEAWRAVFDKAVPLPDLVTHLLYHRAEVANGKALLLRVAQLRIAKRVELLHGVGSGSVNGMTATVTVQGAEREVPVDFPDGLEVRLPLFVGQPAVSLQLELTLDGRGDAILCHVAAPGYAERLVAEFDRMLNEARERLLAEHPTMVIALGAVEHGTWATIPPRL